MDRNKGKLSNDSQQYIFLFIKHGVYEHTDAITKKDVTKRVER